MLHLLFSIINPPIFQSALVVSDRYLTVREEQTPEILWYKAAHVKKIEWKKKVIRNRPIKDSYLLKVANPPKGNFLVR